MRLDCDMVGEGIGHRKWIRGVRGRMGELVKVWGMISKRREVREGMGGSSGAVNCMDVRGR
jgi:hypothetical protein